MTPPIDLSDPTQDHTFPGPCEATESYTSEQRCAIQTARWTNWYIADYVYARPTVIFFCSGIALIGLVNFGWLQIEKRDIVSARPFMRRTVAMSRFLTAKKLRISGWSSISYANCGIISVMGLFFLLMTVVPRPYYWPELTWANSPPVATRTGWLGLAPLPFVATLASKRNPIGYITGVSHEQLQVFHRWVAHFMLLMGLVHTFAFIKFNAQKGSSEERWRTTFQYWTGVAMLVPQAWLSIASLAPFRNVAYEFFKISHRVIAALFVIFFVGFLHCGNLLTSWHYFWAFLTVYGSAVLYRIVTILWIRFRKLQGASATLLVKSHRLLEIRIPTTNLQWTAGQHFFFRFTGLNFFDSWQSHPLTPISIPNGESTELVALAKIRQGQFKLLGDLAQWKKSITTGIWLDGPYGCSLAILSSYDRVLLLGGGSGLTYAVCAANELSITSRATLRLVAVCPDVNQLGVYLEHLHSNTSVQIDGHVTASNKSQDDMEKKGELATEGAASASFSVLKHGRPNLPSILADEAASAPAGYRLAVVACGPSSFSRDVADEVAALQGQICRGKSQLGEVYLRCEAYSW